jgi:hypothetical protein
VSATGQRTKRWPLVVIGGPWPERIGLRARDVTRTMNPHIYPRHGMGRSEVVVLIEHDPFNTPDSYVGWSCVMDRSDLGDAP